MQRTFGNPYAVQQLGPLNAPGLTAPPTAFDDIHGSTFGAYELPQSLAIDQPSGRLYVGGFEARAGETGNGVYVLDDPGPAPTASLDSLSDATATTVTAHATIDPNGPPALSYHFEYSTDGVNWQSMPSVLVGSQATPQSIDTVLEPGGGGFEPSTTYHLRMVAKRPFMTKLISVEKTFTTLPSPPLAETTGSPLRTTTTALLEGRIAPLGSASTYRFEYGEQGPCDSNPCTATELHPAGSGLEFELVAQRIEGLQPSTTYHYRVIADNGNPGSPVAGEDMTVSTFGEEAPLSHGHLPGPPGSDRAWELVSAPDTGGNPVGIGFAPGAASISDNGDRAIYGVAGGTPLSETGTFATRLFAERTPSGWQTKKIYPHREEVTGAQWQDPGGPSDLSTMVAENYPGGSSGEFSFWRMAPSGATTKLYGAHTGPWERSFLAVSEGGSRVLATLGESPDPEHPEPPPAVPIANLVNLYDISSGSPHLVDLLPDGTVPTCGVAQSENLDGFPGGSDRGSHWVSPDGSFAVFPSKGSGSCGAQGLYLRDLVSETTTKLSTPLSGRECDADFIKLTAGAVFFYTQSRLVAKDTEAKDSSPAVGACARTSEASDGDVYRYDLGDGSLECVTCVVPGLDAGVVFQQPGAHIDDEIGVAEDGSRVYFSSNKRLLRGAPATGGTYRVEVASGDLAYVGSFGAIESQAITLGSVKESTMSADGSVVAFRSQAPSLNALGGQQNGGAAQYYLYDDRDRSLVCVSCPADGSAPRGGIFVTLAIGRTGQGANVDALSEDGGTFAFATPTPLVAADQNTARPGQEAEAGTDVYEWRQGRVLLVSDGLTNWPGGEIPKAVGVTPSGHDVFFTEAAQLTPDALDGYRRLYDARIGGGFEFPPPPKPCSLEVCQGTPKGAPEEATPATGSFVGPGNAKASHHEKHRKKKHRKAQSKKKLVHKANHHRRAAR